MRLAEWGTTDSLTKVLCPQHSPYFDSTIASDRIFHSVVQIVGMQVDSVVNLVLSAVKRQRKPLKFEGEKVITGIRSIA
ncbi:MAG: hypothetical protein U0930_09135 [Pirellulales bacterium]